MQASPLSCIHARYGRRRYTCPWPHYRGHQSRARASPPGPGSAVINLSKGVGLPVDTLRETCEHPASRRHEDARRGPEDRDAASCASPAQLFDFPLWAARAAVIGRVPPLESSGTEEVAQRGTAATLFLDRCVFQTARLALLFPGRSCGCMLPSLFICLRPFTCFLTRGFLSFMLAEQTAGKVRPARRSAAH